MKTLRVNQVADRLRKHPATIWRWVARGCDIDSEESIQQFLSGDKRRRNPFQRALASGAAAPIGAKNPNTVQRSNEQNTSAECAVDPQEMEHVAEPQSDLNSIELAPVGRRGAAAALQRLEEIEERAHARLMRAIENGNQFQIKNAQEFYLRTSETLRKLDLAVETERRAAEEQIPLRQVESVAAQISTWLRVTFEQFLNAESPGLMSIKDLGEFKFSAIERFRGILHATVKSSRRTDPLIPEWAAVQVIEGWNIPTP
jgi:hypothetical protein